MEAQQNIQNNAELTKFIKYTKLADELQHHVLTYCNGATLVKYSKCSKKCNEAIQRFNTKPPYHLAIVGKRDGIEVEMNYRKTCRGYTLKKFKFSDSGVFMEDVEKYLLRCYKYVGDKNTDSLKIDVRQWPANLMKMKCILNIKKLEVVIYKSMFDGLMDFLTKSELNLFELNLNDGLKINKATIPADFFKSALFQKLQTVFIYAKCEIDSRDFINLEKMQITMKSSISFDDIRAKVRKLNSERQTRIKNISIIIPRDDDRTFDLAAIFPADQFIHWPVTADISERFRIGKVIVSIVQSNLGKVFGLHSDKD